MGNAEGKEIVMLGLAFRPGTDDIREAPSIDIACMLHERGAKLRLFDPVAMEKAASCSPQM